MNWINQTVIDGIVDGVGKGAVKAAEATYDVLDQGLVDGVVNGAGTVTEGTGEACNPSSPARSVSTARCCSARPPSRALILVIVV